MNTADIITSFFNNELTAEQERQFLLSVAASDSMRLGLKSHVMLDKILADNASDLHITDSVRNTIFAEAEAVLASTGTSSGANTLGGSKSAGSWWQAMRGAFSAKMATGGMAVALAGFGLGYATHSQFADQSVASLPVQSTAPVPTTLRDQSAAVPAPSSTISVPIASATEAQHATAKHSAGRTEGMARRTAPKSITTPVVNAVSIDSQVPSDSAVLPEVPALHQQKEFLKSVVTADSVNPQSTVTSYDHSSNPIPPAQVRAKHSKPNRDSSNQKQQGSTRTP